LALKVGAGIPCFPLKNPETGNIIAGFFKNDSSGLVVFQRIQLLPLFDQRFTSVERLGPKQLTPILS
jgi:hypothetical protein